MTYYHSSQASVLDNMFKWLNKQGVESDEGFSVQVLDRFQVRYSDNRGQITIRMDATLVGSIPTISIFPDAFKIWDDSTPLTSNEQEIVMQRFKDALEFQGVQVVVENAL